MAFRSNSPGSWQELLLNGSLLRKLLGVYPAKIRIYFIGVSSAPGSERTFPFADVKTAIA